MKLLEYDFGKGVRAFSTLRGETHPGNPYSGFNITDYCGDSAVHVAACRNELCKELGILDENLVLPHQIHSDKVVALTGVDTENLPCAHRFALPDADALVTDLRGVCIGVSTADCIPVLLYDAQHHLAAAVHAGWRGAVQRIVAKTVDAMRNLGSDAEDLHAVVGPGIALGSFEVGEEVADAFRDAGFPSSICSRTWPKPHIDLSAACVFQMEEAGMHIGNIRVAGIDTYTDSGRFFSARRLGIHSGRIFTGILLK